MNSNTEMQKPDLFEDEFVLDETGKITIRSLASWAMVIVVTSVLGYVVSIFEAIYKKDTEYVATEGFGAGFTYGSSSVGGTIFVALVGLLINFFLYRFAMQSKRALDSVDVGTLNSSLRSLKIYFVITSIIMILVLLFVLLGMTALLR